MNVISFELCLNGGGYLNSQGENQIHLSSTQGQITISKENNDKYKIVVMIMQSIDSEIFGSSENKVHFLYRVMEHLNELFYV